MPRPALRRGLELHLSIGCAGAATPDESSVADGGGVRPATRNLTLSVEKCTHGGTFSPLVLDIGEEAVVDPQLRSFGDRQVSPAGAVVAVPEVVQLARRVELGGSIWRGAPRIVKRVIVISVPCCL
jgi:hypothetical protein